MSELRQQKTRAAYMTGTPELDHLLKLIKTANRAISSGRLEGVLKPTVEIGITDLEDIIDALWKFAESFDAE